MGITPEPDSQARSVADLQVVEPGEVQRRMEAGDTFVVNVVTAWCPDCTERQNPHLGDFVEAMKSNGIDVLQVNVQLLRRQFLSSEHEQLTDRFGGHGYPRTVLIHKGEVADQDNVEVITADGLTALAQKFAQITSES